MGEAKRPEADSKAGRRPWWRAFLCGGLAGLINGTIGTGGGIVIVPLLRKLGLSPKECHATAVLVILPITVISAGVYLFRDVGIFEATLPYIPAGLAGGLAGAVLLRRINSVVLRKIFAGIMVIAGVRMLF